jgi:hypothetical protein
MYLYVIDHRDRGVSTLLRIMERSRFRISAWRSAISTDIFRGFNQALHTDADILP